MKHSPHVSVLNNSPMTKDHLCFKGHPTCLTQPHPHPTPAPSLPCIQKLTASIMTVLFCLTKGCHINVLVFGIIGGFVAMQWHLTKRHSTFWKCRRRRRPKTLSLKNNNNKAMFFLCFVSVGVQCTPVQCTPCNILCFSCC